MKSKKLLVMVLLLLAGIMAFAQDIEYYQFGWDAFQSYDTSAIRAEQNWGPAQLITLKVSAGSTVYISNKVSSWYWGEDLATTQAGYNMTENNYGYMFAEVDDEGKVTTDHKFHSGTGETKQLTFSGVVDGITYTTTATGYELGTFQDNAEIFLVMTPNRTYPTPETINSYDAVNDPDNVPAVISTLASREINYTDHAGNIVVNFGFVNDPVPGNGREFILGYVAEPPTPPEPPSGQPLPGVLTSCLIALGATGIAARRKHSKK